MPQTISTDSPLAAGLALIVGTPERRRLFVPAVEGQGLSIVEVDDPYIAMAELCRMPGMGSSRVTLVLSLHGIYREELQIIPAVRRRLPHVEIWVTDLDGRSAALAEAMRLGVDGLLSDDGLHRVSERPAVTTDPGTSRVSALSAPAVLHQVAPANGKAGHAAAPMPAGTQNEPRRVAAEPRPPELRAPEPAFADPYDPYGLSPGEPILTAEELRALLHDQPDPTPLGRED